MSMLELSRVPSPRIENYARIYRSNSEPFIIWKRAQPYLPYIKEVFRKKGLPKELGLLPMIESSFLEDAKSPRARGMWQLLKGTARDMGMRVGKNIDERSDWRKSTHAAARYLSLLSKKFNGNWALVLAAYNAGPGDIERAVRSQGTDNYWRLKLRQETMNYVPKMLAMIRVLRREEPHN